MRKIASPQELQSEIHAIMAYIQGPGKPERRVVAAKLRELADRVASGKEAALVIPQDMEAFLIDVVRIFGRKYAKARFTHGGPDIRKTILGPMVTAHYQPYNSARVDTVHIIWVEAKQLFKIDVFGSIPSEDVESEGFQQVHATETEKATSYTMDPEVIARAVLAAAEKLS